jgi:hypothetical protein
MREAMTLHFSTNTRFRDPPIRIDVWSSGYPSKLWCLALVCTGVRLSERSAASAAPCTWTMRVVWWSVQLFRPVHMHCLVSRVHSRSRILLQDTYSTRDRDADFDGLTNDGYHGIRLHDMLTGFRLKGIRRIELISDLKHCLKLWINTDSDTPIPNASSCGQTFWVLISRLPRPLQQRKIWLCSPRN